MLRIYVVEASAKGGLIHYSYHLCRALQRKEAMVTLVTSTAYELDDLEHEFRVEKLLKLWDPRQGRGGNPLWRKVRRGLRGVQYIKEWLKLVLYLRREKPDVVLFGEIRFAFELYFLRMLRMSGLVLADIVHDVQSYDTSRNSTAIIQESETHIARYNRIYQTFDALFVHDRSNRDLFLDVYDVQENHVHEIPLGTNEIILEVKSSHTPQELRDMLEIPQGRKVMLFFGTITKYKGVEDLIRAFGAIYAETGAQLVIAGFPAKDVDVHELKALAVEMGIAEAVSWYLDYVPNEQVTSLMALSDVVVFPYRAITQSAVVQIAYACGKAVVATQVGGLGDVIEDGQSGLLVEPGNPDALAAPIISLLNDSALAEKMGQRAHELSQTKYSWLNVAGQIMSVFEDMQKGE
jgi:glycosyltransferase involved in cell wall biosynthesis